MAGVDSNFVNVVVGSMQVQTGRKMFHAVYVVGLVFSFFTLIAPQARAATIVVTSLADPGSSPTCTLRQAITNADHRGATRLSRCAPVMRVNTIVFAPGVSRTIELQQELPDVTGNLTIIGPTGSRGVTIDGLHEEPPEGLMELTSRANLTVQNLTSATVLHSAAARSTTSKAR